MPAVKYLSCCVQIKMLLTAPKRLKRKREKRVFPWHKRTKCANHSEWRHELGLWNSHSHTYAKSFDIFLLKFSINGMMPLNNLIILNKVAFTIPHKHINSATHTYAYDIRTYRAMTMNIKCKHCEHAEIYTHKHAHFPRTPLTYKSNTITWRLLTTQY